MTDRDPTEPGARRRRTFRHVRAVALACATISAAASAHANAAEPYRLDVGGSPALAVRVACTLVSGAGDDEARTKVRGKAWTPKAYRLEAEAVSCVVRKLDARGRLEVALRRGGRTIASARTSAPYNHVKVRGDGPWGDARGVRGTTRLLVPRGRAPSTREAPAAGTLVPPLKGPIVPPLGQ